MNLRNVLRTYVLLRQLSDDESALLATLRGMNDSEREAMVLAMQPEKGTGKKKSSKKASGGGKSTRASNMAATLNKNLAQQRTQVKCTYVLNADESDAHACEGTENDPIHDPTMAYAGYHEFVAPGAQAASGD